MKESRERSCVPNISWVCHYVRARVGLSVPLCAVVRAYPCVRLCLGVGECLCVCA
jgi:hypothetical protein